VHQKEAKHTAARVVDAPGAIFTETERAEELVLARDAFEFSCELRA
jgi:hypothetical protein